MGKRIGKKLALTALIAVGTLSVYAAGQGGTFFSDAAEPATLDAKGKVELGLKFSAQKAGKISAFLFYQAKSETGPHILRLWGDDGKVVATAEATAATAPGWVEAPLATPFAVTPGKTYVLSYTASAAYPGTPEAFAKPIVRDGVTAVSGLYSFTQLGEKAPDKTFKDMNYFIDIKYAP